MLKAYVLLLTILTVSATTTTTVMYDDLIQLDANCTGRDSCQHDRQRSTDFSNRNCECDELCASFSDCCVDAPTSNARVRGSARFNCRPYNANSTPSNGVYVVDTCPSNYVGPHVVLNKCQLESDWSDPVLAVFVTDTSNAITYRNRYCSECNGASPDNLESWLISLSCSINEGTHLDSSYVWQNIKYQNNSWTLTLNNDTIVCNPVASKPPYVTSPTRECRANVVADCPATWRRNSVRKACQYYMAVVYTDDVTYKNPHCALCHRQLGHLFCDSSVISGRTKKPFSFALLLDVNRNDGEVVGETRSCPEGQRYDPFFKKCRRLVCVLPGHVMVNGKCKKS